MIDTKNGNMEMGEDFRVTKQTRPEELLNHFGTGRAELAEHQNGWVKISLRNVQNGGLFFCFSFWFSQKYLDKISFILDEKEFRFDSWTDWNEETELRRKKYYENWLTREIGAPAGYFDWGSLNVVYDSNGGLASILLRYAQYD